MSFTQPCCIACWPAFCKSVNQSVREPGRLREGYREEETCAFCGIPTRSGIYVRVDPTTVPYPTVRPA